MFTFIPPSLFYHSGFGPCGWCLYLLLWDPVCLVINLSTDPNDVKKALKMHEVEISSKGAGPVAEEEEEHDNEGDHGMEQEQVAMATMNAVAETTLDVVVSAEKEVKGIDVVIETVVDDSQALRDKRDEAENSQVAQEKVSSDDVVVDTTEVKADAASDVEGEPEPGPESEILTSDSEDKVEVKEVTHSEESEAGSDSEVLEATVKTEAEVKSDSEPELLSDPKVSQEVKALPEEIQSEPVLLPEPEVKIVLEAAPEPEAIPEPETKVILKPKRVVRPESKVASLMNPSFLAELAAGLEKAGRKEKSEVKGRA